MKSINDLQNIFINLKKSVPVFKKTFEKNLGSFVVRDIDINFTKAGIDKGKRGGFEKWKVSKASIRRRDPSRPTLTNTRSLRKNVKYEISEDSLKIGIDLNSVPYGKSHQEGTNKLPKREFLYIKDETLEEAILKTEKEIEKKF